MNSRPAQTWPSPPTPQWAALARPQIFWLGAGAVLTVSFLTARGLEDAPEFLLIAITALFPSYLWSRRVTHGLPIFPVFSLGTLLTFGLPFLMQPPEVADYSADEKLAAAATIALTNVAGCVCWLLFTRRVPPPPGSCWAFRFGNGDHIFLAALLADIGFNFVTSSIDLRLDPALFSILRAIIQVLAALAVFVLAFRAGLRQLSPGRMRLFAITVLALVISNLPSVLMVNALSVGALALMAFALGRGRLPGVALISFLGFALFLQAGKSAVREKYWSDAEGAPISFSHFPQFMDDWIGFSWRQIFAPAADDFVPAAASGSVEPQSLAQRASLLHLFLLIQRMTPSDVPYLQGSTYTIIPRLLVPRILNENKARSHLGTYLLAIPYGLQRPEDTSLTTIGFGLINEAMANFGRAGCLGLGALLGSFYGWAARWSATYPLNSLRTFLSILILTVALENEFTASVYVTTLFQGACALLVFGALTMRRVTALAINRAPYPLIPLKPAQPPATAAALS